MSPQRKKGIDGDDLIAWIVNQCTTVRDCWEWQRGRTTSGYGDMRYQGRHLSVHRVTYELLREPIPDGLQIDHLCRNRACCNPWHLEPVTSRENSKRGDTFTARHLALTHCPQGHPYEGENLIIITTGRVHPARRCRTCDRARKIADYARSKEGST